jgi:hypothetical protein
MAAPPSAAPMIGLPQQLAFGAGGASQRTWRIMRKPFQSIPVRGLFYFENGVPSGVFVKASPTEYAVPTAERLNNPHLAFRCVLNRGGGTRWNEPGDFLWYSGTRFSVSRARKVIEVNPSNVRLESDDTDW